MKKIIIMLSISLLTTSCASTPGDPNAKTKQHAAIGATLGAVAGAIIGHKNDPTGGALRGGLAGAAAGGLMGAGTGAYMDKQQAEFEAQLQTERAANQVEIERLQNENLKITMNSEVSFDSGSSAMKPAFGNTLSKVADILAKYSRSSVTIIGHTDSSGSEASNQTLSERRAKSVAFHLQDKGVAAQRITTQGRGETQPRATNETASGRQLNRRVEMLIIPNNNIQ